MWAPLKRRPKDEIDDCVPYGGHGWLRRRSVYYFFSAPRVRGDGAVEKRRQALSSGRGDEDPAMIFEVIKSEFLLQLLMRLLTNFLALMVAASVRRSVVAGRLAR